MYLHNAQILESTLIQNWTTLTTNIKTREELYQQLVFHCHKIGQKQVTNQDQQRVTALIEQNKSVIAKIKQNEIQMSEKEDQIVQKYEGLIIFFENCIKLMGKIGAEILQILKTACNKVRPYDHNASSRFNNFKAAFISLLTQRGKLNLEQAVRLVLDYSKQKMQHFLAKLQRIINFIKTEQLVVLQQMSKMMKNNQISVLCQEKQRENNIFQKKRDLSFKEHKLISKLQIKQNSESFHIQKHEISDLKQTKYEVIKQKTQCRQSEKHLKTDRHIRKKFKLYDSLYNVMLLSKHQPNQDIVGNIDIDIQKKYLELLGRNKQNINQIVNFRNRFEELQQKPQNFEQQANKHSQSQSKSSGFILKIKKRAIQSKDQIEKEDYFHFIATEIQSDTIDKNKSSLGSHMKKIAMKRTKFNNSPHINEDDFPILKYKINRQLLSSIKTDSSKQQKQQQSRGRLPDIKRGSVDQKINLINYKTISEYKEMIDNVQESGIKQSKKRQSFFREERIQSQRTKMILKNVQVGLDLSNKKGQRFCKQQELTSRQRKKTDTTIQSTIYMRRTINKFIDNKLNLFF